MTHLTELYQRIDNTITKETSIELSAEELKLIMKIASLFNGPGVSPPVEQPAAPLPAPKPAGLDLLTLEEAASQLKVSRRTLWLLRKNDPTFPAVVRTSARHKMIVRTEFESWVLGRR